MSEYEFEYAELSRVSFEGLSKRKQQLSWDTRKLRKRLGHGFYDYYAAVGILVEEELPDLTNEQFTDKDVLTNIEVRFFHKLFCEYYASVRLVELVAASETVAELEDILEKLDPFDFEYLYRFSCGIDSAAANKIIQYLNGREGSDKFAILCILEQTGKVDNIKEIVCKLCAHIVYLRNSDSKLLQRSTIQLLEIASKFDVSFYSILFVESVF